MDRARSEVSVCDEVDDTNTMFRLFFRACKSKAQAPEIMGKYRTEYDWISSSILKSRTPLQVRRFAEKLYNQQRINWDQEEMEGSDEDDQSNEEHSDGHDEYFE